MKIRRPCIDCGVLTDGTTRCAKCKTDNDALYDKHYQRRAAIVRANTVACWICGGSARAGDPWQADHVIAGDPRSELRGAHRSCNIKRSNESRRAG